MLSKWLSRYPPLNLRAFLGGLGVATTAVILVLAQPDTGSALVYLVITFGMLFIAGTPLRYLGTLMGLGLAAAPFLWFSSNEGSISPASSQVFSVAVNAALCAGSA